jgi:L-lysine exporter family protein LysE/ArgO
MHLLLLGILLGLGAALPIGPVNLEIIRRNLRFGTSYGIATGLGACSADLTYLVLICLGALTLLLQYPEMLRIIGLVGACILAWFGISALRANKSVDVASHDLLRPSLIRYSIEGYVITLINPYTILFWASISSQISMAAVSYQHAILFAGSGVLIGTIGWVIILNGILHFTRHRLSPRIVPWLNYIGGFILLSFAAIGIWRGLFA